MAHVELLPPIRKLGTGKILLTSLGPTLPCTSRGVEQLDATAWDLLLGSHLAPESTLYHVPALIHQVALYEALQRSHLTLDDVSGEHPWHWPVLEVAPGTVRPLRDQAYISARLARGGGDEHCVVDFYAHDTTPEARRQIQRQYNTTSTRTPWMVFYRYVSERATAPSAQATAVLAWASTDMRNNVLRFFRTPRLATAFDGYDKLEALFPDLPVGNLKRFCDSQCHEELEHGLQRVGRFWLSLTAQPQNIGHHDVQQLSGLRPSTPRDADAIRTLFEGHQVFSAFPGPERDAILNRVLTCRGKVPSLATFNDDVSFLRKGAQISKALCQAQKGPTLRARMSALFEQGPGPGRGCQFEKSYRRWWCHLFTDLEQGSGSSRTGKRKRAGLPDVDVDHDRRQVARSLGFGPVSVPSTEDPEIRHRRPLTPPSPSAFWTFFASDERIPLAEPRTPDDGGDVIHDILAAYGTVPEDGDDDRGAHTASSHYADGVENDSGSRSRPRSISPPRVPRDQFTVEFWHAREDRLRRERCGFADQEALLAHCDELLTQNVLLTRHLRLVDRTTVVHYLRHEPARMIFVTKAATIRTRDGFRRAADLLLHIPLPP